MKKIPFLLVFSLSIFLISCHDDEEFFDEDVSASLKSTKVEEKYKDAKKLKNPYSVKNMQKALDKIKNDLKEKKIKIKEDTPQRLEEGVIDFEINTSHYYIRFLPASVEEEAILKEDPNIHLFDYPLDYEFSDAYLDGRTPSGAEYTPEYFTSVTLGQELPSGVVYEVIEELYIPEEDPFFDTYGMARVAEGTKQGEIGGREDFLRHLLYEAYSQTDNLSDLIGDVADTTNAIWIFGSKWYPSGKLRLWDDNAGQSTTTTKVFSHYEYYDCDTNNPLEPQQRLPDGQCQRAVYTYVTNTVDGKYVPLVGAQVLMRQWFTIRQGITDANGNFSTGSVRGAARYIIQWERYQYSIRNGSLFQAELRGPKKLDESWIKDIKDGDDEYHGMIHTAAHEYYYGDRLGLHSPPTNALLKKQMKIAAREKDGTSSFIHQRRFIELAQIHIKQWGEESQYVYGTTIHELAHAAHWNLDRNSYNNLGFDGYIGGNDGDKRTLETWARTVEIMMTLNRYRVKFNQPNYRYMFELQNQSIESEKYYTSAGYDMIDNYNQRNLSSFYPIDRVSGYTINQLEDALKNTNSWDEWKRNIKNNYSNPTEIYLDELFNNW